MKMYKMLFFILLVLFIGCKNNVDESQFFLSGQYDGHLKNHLILSYLDKNNDFVIDTLVVKNGKFKTTGFINGATLASIKGNIDSNEVSDENFVDFFLESRQLSTSLKENKFKEAKLIGSLTQLDYQSLENETASIYSSIQPLMEERNKLTGIENTKDSIYVNNRLKIISQQWKEKLNEIKLVQLNFIKKNPKSDLSAYWLNFYFNKFPLDSINKYYEALDFDVKNHLYGKIVKEKIETVKKVIVNNIGDKAYNFKLSSYQNEVISLDSYSGKFVLLDFWASWCKPCREASPKLKSIYNTYNSKGLEIIGISSDTSKDAWHEAVQKDGTNLWKQLISEKERLFISTQFDIVRIPTYILIDRNGYIIGRYPNSNSDEENDFSDLKAKLIEIFEATH